MISDLLIANWSSTIDSLITAGSARVEGALGTGLAQRLTDAGRPPWHALPPEEGPVRQAGFGSYLTIAEAEPLVRKVGEEIVQELTKLISTDLPKIPDFNEVSWTRYPAASGHISAHRDPIVYSGIVAIVTLYGQATFNIWGGDVLGTPTEVLAGQTKPTQWNAAAGDLILLGGNGWPTPKARCPMHQADSPLDDERMIMTFRFNTRGAGAGYDVDPD